MMRQGRVPLAVMLCLICELRCGGDSPSSQHKLIIHTTRPQTSTTTSLVFLGDGSVFKSGADAQGDVVFSDSRLTLPQDVTWVQAVTDSPNWVGVMTIAGVDKSEIWLEDVSDSLPPTIETEVSGDVTPHDGSIQVIGAGGDYWASSSLYANGYALNLRGTTPGPIDVVAYSTQSGASGSIVTDVGVVRDVPIVRNANTKQDIALDHPSTPSFVVSAANDSAYGGAESASLVFSFANLPMVLTGSLFANSVTGAFPVTVSTPTMDGALSALRRTLRVSATRAANDHFLEGVDPATFNGSCEIASLDAAATNASVTFLTPAAVTTPVLGKLESPGTAPHDHLAFGWTVDAAATATRLTMSSGGAYNQNPRWVVYLPASQTTFTFPSFVAPNGVSVLNTSTTYQVELESFSYSGVDSATDLWTNPKGPLRVSLGDSRSSYQSGFVTLQ